MALVIAATIQSMLTIKMEYHHLLLRRPAFFIFLDEITVKRVNPVVPDIKAEGIQFRVVEKETTIEIHPILMLRAQELIGKETDSVTCLAQHNRKEHPISPLRCTIQTGSGEQTLEDAASKIPRCHSIVEGNQTSLPAHTVHQWSGRRTVTEQLAMMLAITLSYYQNNVRQSCHTAVHFYLLHIPA